MLLRNLSVGLIVFASACSTAGHSRGKADEAWREIERARLRVLVAGRSGVDDAAGADLERYRQQRSTRAARPVAPQEPAPAARAQDPVERAPAPAAANRHIDDILPPRRRSYREAVPTPPYVARAGFGIGELGVHAKGTRLHDDERVYAGAVTVEPGVESRVGPGVRLEAMQTGGDLFAGELVNDGFSVRKAEAQARSIDVFPHLVLRPDTGERLDVPIRVGGFVDYLDVGHRFGALDRTWFGYGTRVEVEPRFKLADEDGWEFDVRGLLGAGFGGVRFRETYVGGSDDDTTLRVMGEAGVGFGARCGNFVGDVGYRFRTITNGRVDTALFGDVDRTVVRSNVLFVDAGIRF